MKNSRCSSRMACYEIYLTLSVLISCRVNANYQNLKTWSRLVDVSQVPLNSHYDIYESSSSEVLPHYYDFYESSRDGSGDHFGSSSEHLPDFKKESRRENEEKTSKKSIIPFYALEDSFKHKEFVPLLAVAHCREVKVKSIGKGPRESVTTCYKCKDPKTKSTYERCSYNGHPKGSGSASTNVERFLSAPVNFRYRRSNLEKDVARDSYDDYHGKPRNPYRFDDEYFIGATHNVQAAYENKGEICDKVVKDSMVCMVCKDPKTNGKYEQCSYVTQPHEKAYSYTKSSSFGKPHEREDESVDQPEETTYSGSPSFEASDRGKDRKPTVVQESRSRYYPSEDHFSKASTEEAKERDDRERDDTASADCRKVQRDSKTCVICKDSKTGRVYEKCTYDFQPNEKLYKYSKSKSFDYPDRTSDSSLSHETAETPDKSTDYPQDSDSTHDYFGTGRLEVSAYPRTSGKLGKAKITSQNHDSDDDSVERSNTRNYPEESSNTEYPISSGNTNSESDSESYEGTQPKSARSKSEGNSEDIDVDHCRKFQRDSMTCTVCKDPKTGNDFERCSYSYQPSDKLFSYSKSTKFGNSQRDRSHEAPHQDEETDGSESTKGSYGYIPGEAYEASTIDKTTSTDDAVKKQQNKKEVDTGYLNTARKKEEIEEFVQNFGKEDRSKCKKVMRDKMTCYQCVDEDGFQKEECVFVTGREADEAQRAFHDLKQFQSDPASSSSARRLDPPAATKARSVEPLEPNASASGNSYVRLEKPDNEYPEEAPLAAEETKEAEPYDYTSETRSRYDKVLGFTLPAYMLTTSEHEAAFDELVASSHDRR